MGLKRVLHAGCGSPLNQVPFEYSGHIETRLDIDRLCEPNIVSSIVAMPMVENDSYDAIFCCHTLEHLYGFEVHLALREFHRVLKPGGEVWLQVPDLQAVGGKIALDKLDEVVYQSHIGPVTPLDMLYGRRASLVSGNLHMAHKTGFTASVLKVCLANAGFNNIVTDRDRPFELKALARKAEVVHASEESGPAGTAELEVRACVGEAASL